MFPPIRLWTAWGLNLNVAVQSLPKLQLWVNIH